MSKTSTHRFVIESAQFAKLERALSVALPAARSLGVDTGIFWMHCSIFAATPYASIGLDKNFDLDFLDWSKCIAISQLAARSLIFELQTRCVRYLKRIEVVVTGKEVVFRFEHDRKSKLTVPPLVSRYSGPWEPRLTPDEQCALLFAHRLDYECTFSIEEVRRKLRSNEDYGYIVLEYLQAVDSPGSMSRSLLSALLKVVKDENAIFRTSYYKDQRCVVFRAGDVIAVFSVID